MIRAISVVFLVALIELSAFGQGTEEIGDKFLSFIHSAAQLLGEGLVRLINLILPAGREVSADLASPLGYLGLITLVLLLFGILEAARKVIWIAVVVGWVLMVVRIILGVFSAK